MIGLTARLLAGLLLLAGSCALAEDDTEAFRKWARGAPVAEFEAFLATAGVHHLIATRQLLRTATDWDRCGGPRFEIPPRELWPEVAKVLGLVKELRRRNILTSFEAVSNYRNPVLNACAGGAKRSSHTRTFAIDVLPEGGRLDEKLLCDFWRKDGQIWQMGLSKYPSGRIHLDLSGYRTWGADHTRHSSFCG